MDDGEKKIVDEEAIAEEEFVADLEDTIENPLVHDGDKITVLDKKSSSEDEKEELVGAIGSGELQVEEPINNEEALRSEKMNNGDNPFSPDSDSGKEFNGPDKAPLDDATETIVPAVPEEEKPADAETTEPAASEEPAAPAAETADAPASTAFGATADAAPTDTVASMAAAEAPVVTNAPTVEDLANGTPPKKKKGGLIAGIIIVVLLIGLAVGGVIFYMTHESKERMVSDGITGLISAEATQFDGTMTMSSKKASESFKDITLTFKADENGANFSGTGSLKITPASGKDITIDVSAAYISGDGVYFKADNLKNALDEDFLLQMMGAEGSNEEMGELGKLITSLLSSVVEAVDGNWFKINADAFASDQTSKEKYECITKAIDDISKQETKDKLVAIYKKHPFIENDNKGDESGDGLQYFSVKTNSSKSQAFADEAKSLDAVKDLKTCTEGSDSSDIDEEDGEEGEEADEITAEVKLGITGWQHELKAIKGTIENKNSKVDLDLKIGYEKKAVSAPTDSAKSIEDLYKDVMTAFTKSTYFKTLIDTQVKKMCASYASNTTLYNTCIEKYTELYNQELMKELTGMFTPAITYTSIKL